MNIEFGEMGEAPLPMAQELFVSRAYRDLRSSSKMIFMLLSFKIELDSWIDEDGAIVHDVVNNEHLKLTYREIEEKLGYKQKAIWSALKELFAHGFIRFSARSTVGKASAYDIIEDWRTWEDGMVIRHMPSPGKSIKATIIRDKRSAEYIQFINSQEWRGIRQRIFKSRGKKCQDCGSISDIHVHHLTYRRFGGKEKDSDLKVLCRDCHMKLHPKMGSVKKPKKRPSLRKRTVKHFGLKNKGTRGWRGLAKAVYLIKFGRHPKFTSSKHAQSCVRKIMADIEL